MGFLWAQTYIYYCANEPISPHICAVVRAGMFSCLNIIRIIVLEEGEGEDEEGGRGSRLFYAGWNALFGETFVGERKKDRKTETLSHSFLIPQIYGSSPFPLRSSASDPVRASRSAIRKREGVRE